MFDAVVRVEDRCVNDRSESLAGRIRCIGCDERVNEDLVPFQHLIGFLSNGFVTRWCEPLCWTTNKQRHVAPQLFVTIVSSHAARVRQGDQSQSEAKNY